LISDNVTTLGTGVDNALVRKDIAYDSQGHAFLFTSYDDENEVINQVKRQFNGLGQLITEFQEHEGEVDEFTSTVQYVYSEMAGGANHSRLQKMIYPDGRILHYGYSSGLNNNISRLSFLADDGSGTPGTHLEEYSFLGLGTVVVRAHPEPDVDLTYLKQGSEPVGDAGDQYTGLDRFGRIVDQRWLDSSGAATDRFQYGYDRNSNRLYRENLLEAAFSELYAYDDLNQLTSFARGTLNSTKDAISGSASRTQAWTLDAMGNWTTLTTDTVAENRTHDAQNEVTGVGSNNQTFDANGNLTNDENGNQLFYDAWNHLVEVQDDLDNPLASYGYDTLGRRIIEIHGAETKELYYSTAWQVLEEQIEGDTAIQYVWSRVYVDALVLRDRDTNDNGLVDERLYVQQDANYNVTALLDTFGNVEERYVYDPYGKATVLDDAWSTLTSSAYDWQYLHQGGRLDEETGLYSFRHREFSPTLGRWLQNDPLSFGGGDTNLYGYIGNGPGNALDPSGLLSFWDEVGMIGNFIWNHTGEAGSIAWGTVQSGESFDSLMGLTDRMIGHSLEIITGGYYTNSGPLRGPVFGNYGAFYAGYDTVGTPWQTVTDVVLIVWSANQMVHGAWDIASALHNPRLRGGVGGGAWALELILNPDLALGVVRAGGGCVVGAGAFRSLKELIFRVDVPNPGGAQNPDVLKAQELMEEVRRLRELKAEAQRLNAPNRVRHLSQRIQNLLDQIDKIFGIE
jgi:RHS repeat-associated protein